MVLVQLSVVEQRLDVVRAVLAGAMATEVAASVGVSRQSVVRRSRRDHSRCQGNPDCEVDLWRTAGGKRGEAVRPRRDGEIANDEGECGGRNRGGQPVS